MRAAHRLTAIMIAIIMIAYPTPSTYSQFIIASPKVSYAFGEFLIFYGTLEKPDEIKQCTLFLNIPGEDDTFSSLLEIRLDGKYEYKFPLTDHSLRAFSTITYWIEVTFNDNQVLSSEPKSLFYEDSRYLWKSLSSNPIQVYWYDREQSFGKFLMDTAHSGQEGINKLLPLASPYLIKVYAYSSSQELRDTLQIAGQTWIGAHTDPDLGIIMLSIPDGPEQIIEMERQIPHELMHILLYHELGPSYQNLPFWLSEGLASIAELSPNPDYAILLQTASDQDNLLPIQSLCKSFPKEVSGAYLAYAEAASFTRYLVDIYGSPKLMELIFLYQDGLGCDQAAQNVYNQDLEMLDHQWRRDVLGEIIWKNIFMNILPWLIILICVFTVPSVIFFTSVKKFNTSHHDDFEESSHD
jgi:hypothetical protein